ncbi:MAG: hypothetical protein IT435_16195 [Phycisphaerales bacterium]|nr:hypothetical protein [Phycisphaerales bacterium]
MVVKLTKERRIYLAILGLGLSGVAVDRLWLSAGPKTASAAATPVAMLDEEPDAEVPKTSSVVSVAKRLESIQSEVGTDAFVIPASWMPKETPAKPDAPGLAGAPAKESAPRHRITSVVGRGDAITAVIDGQFHRLGGKAKDGIRLLKVEKTQALIEVNGQREIIPIVEPLKER